MKVTNGDIFGARQAMAEILKIDLPVKTSWMLVKLASKLNSLLTVIDGTRNKLIEKYGEPDSETGVAKTINSSISTPSPEKDGEPTITPNPKWADFVREENELMAQEEDIGMEKIKIPEEAGGKPVMVSAMALGALEKFIEV